MAKEEPLKFPGKVIEVLGNSLFKVQLETKQILNATIGGKLRLNNIKIILGDSVDVEVTPYDLTKGRIVYRRM